MITREFYSSYLLRLPLAQFRALQKAFVTLVRAGVDEQTALDVLIPAHEAMQINRRNDAIALRVSNRR
jgi:hypothetical protein